MSPRISVCLVAFLAASTAYGQSTAAAFDAPIVIGGDFTRLTNTLDFDGDGWKDAIGTWYPPSTSASVRVQGWRNDQTGRLAEVWSVDLPLGFFTLSNVDLATGDMNQDGRDDFVLALGGTLHFYLSNGASAPTPWATVLAGGLVQGVQMSDFNGDGVADVACLTDFAVKVLLVTPSGPPFATSSMNVGVATIYHLFLADADGVGAKDVGVTTTQSSTQVYLYPVVGGVLQAPQGFVLFGEVGPMPTAGDIDNDGDEDVVVFGAYAYRVLRRTGATSFSLEPYVTGGPATGLADVDNDGDLDGVCCGGGGNGPPANLYFAQFEISMNGGGVFAPAFTFAGLGSARLAGAVDLDHDGDLDLVAGRCAYYPDGPITQSPLHPAGSTFQTPRTIADVDGDGDPDLQPGVATPAVFRSNGDGTFTSGALVLPAAPAGTAFVGPGWPGDFDGDGDADLVVVQQATGGAFLAMRLLRNNGGGGFVDGGAAGAQGVDFRSIPSTPQAPVTLDADSSLVADADADGDLDLIVRVGSGYYVASMIWWNGGSGFFTAGQDFAGSFVLSVANFDASPPPDVIGTYASGVGLSGPVKLCRGLGAGAFGPPDVTPLSTVAAWWDRCAVKDLDGDGDLDVVVPSGPYVWFDVNDGNGNFTPAPAVIPLETAGSTPRRVFIHDVNADGVDDVVAVPGLNTGSLGTVIRFGTGTPLIYQPGVIQMITPSAFADIDGDGDADMLGTKAVLNRRFAVPANGLRRQYGAGLAGTGGVVPVLGSIGPFRSGLSGQTRIRGGLGGAYAVFGLGLVETSTPLVGGTLLTNPVVVFDFYLEGAPGVAGAGAFTLSWTAFPWLVGTSYFQQVGIADPGAPQGVSLTNGLHILIGP